jgi:hypothetical protein
MFESNVEAKGGGECKPDPEEMLQRARKIIEACDKAQNLIFELDELPIYLSDSDNSFKQTLGQIAIQRYQAKKQENYWLNEIDKPK